MPQVQTQAVPGINSGGSYFQQATPAPYETQAGVATPQYLSMLDENGNLKSPFQFDPSKSSAFMQEKGIAQDTSQLSPWAQLQQQQLHMQTQGARDAANTSALGSTHQAMDQMMTTGGGLSSGALQNLTAQGARNATMANQNILNQETGGNLSIAQQDALNKQQILGQVANTETGALAANTQTGVGDLSNQNIFNTNRYNQQMSAWGAGQTADAQSRASNGVKGK